MRGVARHGEVAARGGRSGQSRVAKGLPNGRAPLYPARWWAHFEFTRIIIAPTILRKKIEELMNVRGIGEASFLKLKSLVTITPPRTERAAAQTP